MQVYKTTDQFRCSRCGQAYELADETERNGDRLPWLVVPDDIDAASVDKVIGHVQCQNCLDFTGPKERGLVVMLKGLGVTILKETETSVLAGISFPDPFAQSGVSAGIPLPAAPSVDLVGIPFPTMAPVPSVAFELPRIAPVAAQLPTVPAPVVGGSGNMFDVLTAQALHVDEERREERRRTRTSRPDQASGERLSRRTPEPLRGGIGYKNAAALKEVSDRIQRQAQEASDAAFAALSGIVVALKRTRKREVIEMLCKLSGSLKQAVRVDTKKRSAADLLIAAGAPQGWLAKRFSSYVIAQIMGTLQTSLVWHFTLVKPFATALAMVDMDEESMRAAALGQIMNQLRELLGKIRELASSVDVEPLVEDLIGWATYATLVDDRCSPISNEPGLSRDEIFGELGTSHEELEELIDERYRHMRVAPDDSDGSGGGTHLEKRTPPSRGKRIVRQMKLHGNLQYADGAMREIATTIEVTELSMGTLPEPNAPLPRIPAGTQAPVAQGTSKIIYPEGREYGDEPTLVLGGDDHKFTAKVREGDEVREYPVMGRGQQAHMLRVDSSWPVTRSVWVLRPLLPDGEEVLVDLVDADGTLEDWADVWALERTKSVLHTLIDACNEQESGHVGDLIRALACACMDETQDLGPEIQLREGEAKDEQPFMVPEDVTEHRVHAE